MIRHGRFYWFVTREYIYVRNPRTGVSKTYRNFGFALADARRARRMEVTV